MTSANVVDNVHDVWVLRVGAMELGILRVLAQTLRDELDLSIAVLAAHASELRCLFCSEQLA